MKGVALLGATGSIGASTLAVLARHPEDYRVVGVSAHVSVDALFDICRALSPETAVMADPDAAARLASRLAALGSDTRVEHGEAALEALATSPDVDVVVSAIVGAAALLPTLAAARAGKRILLANKEALVMSGDLLMREARAAGALLMPVDSEHNAIFQSLPVRTGAADGVARGVSTVGIEKVLLTASGGPFRETPLDELRVATVQQAVAHPNWSMGPKISVDSATLMNKGLEVIEACVLFELDVETIEVVVHPESIVHSMVRYRDGSVIAQLGRPDMRTPIAHALAWPARIDAGVEPLDLVAVSGLHFERPDLERFPALGLAFAAQARGGSAPAVLNAANEVAVQAFLDGRVAFLQLVDVVERTLARAKISPVPDLVTIIAADGDAREIAAEEVAALAGDAVGGRSRRP